MRIVFSAERPPSAIAGRRGGGIGRVGSEGTRPALLPAGPVPERRNVRSVFIETTDGPAIRWTGWLALFFLIEAVLEDAMLWPIRDKR